MAKAKQKKPTTSVKRISSVKDKKTKTQENTKKTEQKSEWLWWLIIAVIIICLGLWLFL